MQSPWLEGAERLFLMPGFAPGDEVDANGEPTGPYDGQPVDCPLHVGQRVILHGTYLYGTVIATTDGDVDYEDGRYFLCAQPMATVAWDDGDTDEHVLNDLTVELKVIPEFLP